MWSARGAYRNTEGQMIYLDERSPMWTDRTRLLRQIEHDHPGLMPVQMGISKLHGNRYRWVDEAGVERFVVIEERE